MKSFDAWHSLFSGAGVSAASTPWSEDGGRELPVPSGATGSDLNMMKDMERVLGTYSAVA